MAVFIFCYFFSEMNPTQYKPPLYPPHTQPPEVTGRKRTKKDRACKSFTKRRELTLTKTFFLQVTFVDGKK